MFLLFGLLLQFGERSWVLNETCLFVGAMALKAYPDGCTCLYWEFEAHTGHICCT